ncbi:hypothetical protein GOODEAATRI_002561 [Goodea atripinnis]|uniref:Uncharacterized protein n=1 Tax=Goodea atripinnis TaxID=208336 RepID=A0ABV0N1A0_9TELE
MFNCVRDMIYDLIEKAATKFVIAHPVMFWYLFTTFSYSRYLDLDLVVRDKDGNILDPELTSTVSLFREHEAASKQIEDRIQEEKVSKGRIWPYS